MVSCFYTTILLGLCISGILSASTVPAQENKKILVNPSPDWVHPAQRDYYPGYNILREQKKTRTLWHYATNRPKGNIRGGGTTDFQNFKPLYQPGKTPEKKER